MKIDIRPHQIDYLFVGSRRLNISNSDFFLKKIKIPPASGNLARITFLYFSFFFFLPNLRNVCNQQAHNRCLLSAFATAFVIIPTCAEEKYQNANRNS